MKKQVEVVIVGAFLLLLLLLPFLLLLYHHYFPSEIARLAMSSVVDIIPSLIFIHNVVLGLGRNLS